MNTLTQLLNLRRGPYKFSFGASVEDSLWARIDKRGPDECWPWLGVKQNRGYGVMILRKAGKKFRYIPTRLSWSLANNQPWPEGKIACHHCDNPSCCNPAHIFVGTDADNVKDMHAKGRWSRPIKSHCAHGHPFTGERNRSGHQFCRICYERWNAKHTLELREKRKAARARMEMET